MRDALSLRTLRKPGNSPASFSWQRAGPGILDKQDGFKNFNWLMDLSLDFRKLSRDLLFVGLLATLLALYGTTIGTPGTAFAAVSSQGHQGQEFSGAAFIEGQPAPQGTVVAVLDSGTQIASVSVDASGRYSNLQVPTAGIFVTFTVDGLASGLHVYGEGFATDSAAGTASGTYNVSPGQSVTVYLNVKANKPGVLLIQFSGAYWPEGNKDLYNPVSLSHSFTVNQASTNPLSSAPSNPGQYSGEGTGSQSGSGSTGDGDPSVSCSLSPSSSGASGAGDTALLALPLLGLAGMVAVRRRRGS